MSSFQQEELARTPNKIRNVNPLSCFIDDQHHMNYNLFQKTKRKTESVSISVFSKENSRVDLWLRKLANKTCDFSNIHNLEITFPFSFGESTFIETSHQLSRLTQLKKLIINSVQSNNVTDKAVAALGISLTKLISLETLNIDFSRFTQITDKAIQSLGQSICRSKTLKSLSLTASTCEKLTNKSLAYLSSKLVKIQSLRGLVLEYNNCTAISDDGLVGLSENIAKMKNLTSLKLNFYMCSLTDRGISKLGEGLAQVPGINNLDLFFSSGQSTNWTGLSVNGIEVLCSNIAKLKALEKFTLKFGWSDSIEDSALISINNNVLKLKNLSSLEFGFYFCKSITNEGISELTKNFGKLYEANTFKLNIWSCDHINDAGIIDACINTVKLPKFKHFEINSDNFGWKIFQSQKKVLDFATSLMLKRTHKKLSKHKKSIFMFFTVLAILNLLVMFTPQLFDKIAI